jgi:hypothetical protein
MYSRSRDIGVATTAVIFGFIPAAVAVIASQTSVSVAEPYEKPTGSSFAGEAAVLAQSIGLAQTIDAWSSSPVELELRQIAFAIGEAAHRRGASAIDVDALRARLVETADGSGRTFSTRTRRMIDGLVSLMDSWYWHRLYLGDSPAHEVAERATRVAQLGLIAAVVFVPLLLLYAGFFWSVRIATVGAVELLAIESEADAIDTEPESLDSRLMATG